LELISFLFRNPEEHTILDFAVIIRDLVGSGSEIINMPKQEDDPQQRRPDIRRAADLLNWRPKVKYFVLAIKLSVLGSHA
jgi:nucleoside-diphosphate-sugar epimerase